MLFWTVAALLTLGACLAVLAPLSRQRAPAGGPADHDLEVYRDQLAELQRDRARGVIGDAEAEEARAEIGRRILKLGSEAPAAGRASGSTIARRVGMAAVLAIPLVSWGIYGFTGTPNYPAQPLSARMTKAPGDSSIEELVARAESHLAAAPDDGRGWDVLAPVYFRMGRYADAVTAYSNAIRLDGATAARQSGLGEAMAAQAGGIVTAEARAAFGRAVTLEPSDPKARFFLATALAQEDRLAEASDAWGALLTDLPADSPWRSAVEQAISEAQARMAAAGQPGPGAADMAAAEKMSPQDRAAMISGMVAELDRKLRENPADAEGWRRLVRSYSVLGRQAEAKDALGRGLAALGADSEAGKGLLAFAAELGVKEQAAQ